MALVVVSHSSDLIILHLFPIEEESCNCIHNFQLIFQNFKLLHMLEQLNRATVRFYKYILHYETFEWLELFQESHMLFQEYLLSVKQMPIECFNLLFHY
jgi:hypothetical protein